MIGINYSPLEFFNSITKQHHRKWYADGQTWPVSTGLNRLPPFQYIITGGVTSGDNVGDITLIHLATGTQTPLYGFGGVNELPGLSVEVYGDDRIVVYNGIAQFPTVDVEPGEYYIEMQIGAGSVFSEVFGMEIDVSNYLKLSWWHNEALPHESGAYVYPIDYKNFLYINTELARPKMIYEDEVLPRNGFLFKIKQTRIKELTFTFVATEGVLDIISLVNHHHNIRVEYRGDEYEIVDFKPLEDWSIQKGALCSIVVVMRTGVVTSNVGNPSVQAEYSDGYGDAYTN